MSKLIAIRHGQSTWNAENRFTGWVDVGLSDQGVEEAKISGELIKNLNLNFDVCFTSYLKRAINTLEIIMKVIKKKNKFIKAWQLNERHYGSLTGLNKAETKKKIGDEKFNTYRRSWNIPPPNLDKNSKYSSHQDKLYKDLKNIPSTESLKDTYERVVPYFEKNMLNQIKQRKNIILSAHGNTIRALGKKIFNISDENINLLEIPTGNPLVIEFDDFGNFKDAKYLDESRKKEIIFNK